VAHSQLDQPKRGYLANIWTFPPLIYPFQYNPTQIVESKKLEWGTKHTAPERGIEGLVAGAKADIAAFGEGKLAGIGKTLKTSTEVMGRTFSAAELKRFEKEGPRTVTFQFTIDGHELRPGEPERRRNAEGDILADLAVIRSFVYPQIGNWIDAAGAHGTALGATTAAAPAAGESAEVPTTFMNMWFNEPPTATLVLGGSSIEGFVEDLRITETEFNPQLNPTRAEVELTILEKINSVSFVIDSVKRIVRMAIHSDYDDIGNVVF
jgi:hypothetical protein